jgi:hypothetical protein
MPTSASPSGIATIQASSRTGHGSRVRSFAGRGIAAFAPLDFGAFGGVAAAPTMAGSTTGVVCTTTGSRSRSRRRSGGGAGSVAEPDPERRGGGAPAPDDTGRRSSALT